MTEKIKGKKPHQIIIDDPHGPVPEGVGKILETVANFPNLDGSCPSKADPDTSVDGMDPPEKSNLEIHAEREMRLAGLYKEDSDYGGMIPEAVLKLVRAHSGNGHSGGSHWLTLQIFNKVVNFKFLTPLTSDPEDWIDVGGTIGSKMWQNRRQSDCFSPDGGKTYYSVDDPKREIKET